MSSKEAQEVFEKLMGYAVNSEIDRKLLAGIFEKPQLVEKKQLQNRVLHQMPPANGDSILGLTGDGNSMNHGTMSYVEMTNINRRHVDSSPPIPVRFKR